MLALFLAFGLRLATFAIYGCPVTKPTLIEMKNFPLDWLMLSTTYSLNSTLSSMTRPKGWT